MKKLLTLLGVFFLCALSARGQITTVTGQVKDANGVPYAGATVKAQLVVSGSAVSGQPTVTNNSTASCRQAGFGNAPCQIPFQGTYGPFTLDSSGNFPGGGVNLQDNTQVTPASTQWLFSVTTSGAPPPLGTGPQACTATITISGASQSVSSSFSTCPALSSSGSPTPGVFNSNFDPPLFQNYSLTTTGAQAAINLTATPIDTHTISWRPSGTVTTCTVALDTSPDGITWTAGGAIAGQTCTSAGQGQSTQPLVANFVRVNLTTLTGGGTVTIVYSGRLAPALSYIGNPISNGLTVGNPGGGQSDYAVCNLSGTTTAHNFTIVARVLTPFGISVVTNTATNAVGTAGQLVPIPIVLLPYGQLQSMACFDAAAGGGLANGQIWAQLYIVSASVAPTTCCGGANTYLAAGYLSGFQWVSWSATTPSPPTEVPSTMGWNRTVTIANPAAGAQFSGSFCPNSGGVRCRLISVAFDLITNATTANRLVVLEINSGGVEFLFSAPAVQTASLTTFYNYCAACGEWVSPTSGTRPSMTMSLPTWIESDNLHTWTVQSLIDSLQAGDQISNITFYIQVWQEND